jgi:hypothetical protein
LSVLFFSSSTKCWLGAFCTSSASYNHTKLPPGLGHPGVLHNMRTSSRTPNI